MTPGQVVRDNRDTLSRTTGQDNTPPLRGCPVPVSQPSLDKHLLLTVEEVAGLLRTTAKAIYAMVERGRLPGVRHVGRRVLFSRPELLHFLDHTCASSPKETRR